MRYILLFLATPLVLLWGWFFLSYYDWNFGFLFLSREFHDFAFQIYGQILGIEPSTIPVLVAKACVVDTLIILALFAFRRRREIIAWVGEKRERYFGAAEASVLNRSSAP